MKGNIPGILTAGLALPLLAASFNANAADPADEAALTASGKKQFMRCSACHTMQAGDGSTWGRTLRALRSEAAPQGTYCLPEEPGLLSNAQRRIRGQPSPTPAAALQPSHQSISIPPSPMSPNTSAQNAVA